MSIAYCFWDRRPTKKSVVLSYFLFLVVLTSMSCANFATGDELINKKAQALIDLVLVVLGTIVVLELLQIHPVSTPGVVLRAVIVFLVTLEAIALPGIYGVLWLLNWQGAIGAGGTRVFNPGWISACAAGISAFIGVLNYRSTQRAHKVEVQRSKSIVIPT